MRDKIAAYEFMQTAANTAISGHEMERNSPKDFSDVELVSKIGIIPKKPIRRPTHCLRESNSLNAINEKRAVTKGAIFNKNAILLAGILSSPQ